jgi:hypothetical protein
MKNYPESIKGGLSFSEAMSRGVRCLTARDIPVSAAVEDCAAKWIAEKWEALPDEVSEARLIASVANILALTVREALGNGKAQTQA